MCCYIYLLIYRFYSQRIYSTRYTKHEVNKNRDCPLRQADAAPPATTRGYVGGGDTVLDRTPLPCEPRYTISLHRVKVVQDIPDLIFVGEKKPTVKPQEKPDRYNQIVF